MRVEKILAEVVGAVSECLHRRRWEVVCDLVSAMLSSRASTVTALGRALLRPGAEKHAIKRADRALSNRHLQAERWPLWAGIAAFVLGRARQPVVLIDWSDACPGLAMLRASAPFRGRSVTIFSASYRSKSKSNERRFLEQLAQVLPEGCRPAVVVDAGFQGSFFKVVRKLGWDYVGRLRKDIRLRNAIRRTNVAALQSEAPREPRDLGMFLVTLRSEYPARLVSYDGRSRRARRARTPRGQQQQRRARRREQSPLVLVTSLQSLSAADIVAMYRSRMQIELSFRDDKSNRFGAGLGYVRCGNPARLDILLLLLALASLVLALLGLLTHARGLVASMQANTTRHRTVLSLLTLGRRFLARNLPLPNPAELATAVHALRAGVRYINPILRGDP